MRALYLYFMETANDRRSSSPTENMPSVDDGPLTPIEPGAFSRWMTSRERDAREGKVTRGAGAGHPCDLDRNERAPASWSLRDGATARTGAARRHG